MWAVPAHGVDLLTGAMGDVPDQEVIEPEDGSKDAFVHISAVERAGLTSLSEGQKVSYELQPGQNGKSSAENLSVID